MEATQTAYATSGSDDLPERLDVADACPEVREVETGDYQEVVWLVSVEEIDKRRRLDEGADDPEDGRVLSQPVVQLWAPTPAYKANEETVPAVSVSSKPSKRPDCSTAREAFRSTCCCSCPTRRGFEPGSRAWATAACSMRRSEVLIY